MKRSRKPEFDWRKLPQFVKGCPVEIIRPNIHAGHSGVVSGMTQDGKHIIDVPLHNPTPLTKTWQASAYGDELVESL